jgi:hypothetical protein
VAVVDGNSLAKEGKSVICPLHTWFATVSSLEGLHVKG